MGKLEWVKLVEQREIELTKADLECKEGHVMFFRNNTKLPIWTPPEGSDVYGDTHPEVQQREGSNPLGRSGVRSFGMRTPRWNNFHCR